jgi:hypothetical protein
MFCGVVLSFGFAFGQQNEESNHGRKFEQLGTILPTPNQFRNADGAPGPNYWQQRCDYDIKCSLDVKEQRLHGQEKITYHNESPSTLKYIWLQLDENEHNTSSTKHYQDGSKIGKAMSEKALQGLEPWRGLDKYGHKIQKVVDANGKALKYIINKSNMRIDLPKALKPGESFTFNVDWNYLMIDRMNSTTWGRGGFEHFEDNDNYLYTVVQWYPRMCVYNDATGWQNKEFVGTGEFALTFGDFKVAITVPKDHMVGSTGECQNYDDVLTKTQKERWKKAQDTKEIMEIVTLDEAKANEKTATSNETQTWIYEAKNVRDFAWTASKKFVWDAIPYKTESGKTVMCMSYYGKEAYPIYRKYSTKSVAHTLKTYSKYSFEYPYPVAISVEAANGMEYPMICFNPGRAEEDGTYTERAKNACITVVIHEVGHNYFPMIINSDERQWAWFDEGLNSFLQFVAEQEFDNNYKSTGGPAHMIAGYMGSDKDELEPIMTNSENIVSYFDNAYNKPATALNILRETIMGRELFDYAFREYCQRWKFKHPTPADFFRTMEDASGTDLDWFWKGWFFSTDAVDIAIDTVVWYQVDLKADPKKKDYTYTNRAEKPYDHITKKRYREAGTKFPVEEDETLQDFYTNYKQWEEADSVTEGTIKLYEETYKKKEKKKLYKDKNYYELKFSNKGGLVMPIIIEWTFEDGTTEIETVPVEIWRHNEETVTKVFVKNKEVKSITLDPNRETADTDEANNQWPKDLTPKPSRFKVYKKHKYEEVQNSMQRAKEAGN